MSFLDRVKVFLLGEKLPTPIGVFNNLKNCKESTCFYYTTKTGHFGYCNKMLINIETNLAQTCPYFEYLVLEQTPISLGEMNIRSSGYTQSPNQLLDEDDGEISTASATLVTIKTMQIIGLGQGYANKMYYEAYCANGRLVITVQSSRIGETTELDVALSNSVYQTFLLVFSQNYSGDLITVRIKAQAYSGLTVYERTTKVYGTLVQSIIYGLAAAIPFP